MPIKDEQIKERDRQIEEILKDLIDESHENYRRVICGALFRAYNRGFDAGWHEGARADDGGGES